MVAMVAQRLNTSELLKFSFKSPFPVLLTSLWGRKMAPAGSSSWGSRRPGLAWALTAGSLPRGQATISC